MALRLPTDGSFIDEIEALASGPDNEEFTCARCGEPISFARIKNNDSLCAHCANGEESR